MSLRRRLFLAAAAVLVTLGALGVLLLSSVSHSEIGQIDHELRDSFPATRSLNGATPSPPATVPFGRIRPFSATHVSALYIALVRGSHRTEFSTPLGLRGDVPIVPAFVATSAAHATIETVPSVSGPIRWRAMLLRRPGTTGALLVAAPLNQVDSTLAFLRISLLVSGIVVVGVMGAAGFWVSRLGLGPLAELTEVARATTSGDRSRRMSVSRRGTEAAQLAEAFNLMRDEQLHAEDRLRQFVADASHELRTPVTTVVGITDLWRRGDLHERDQVDDALRRIGVAGHHMARLVEELLWLARLDEGHAFVRHDLDIGEIAGEVVEQIRPLSPARAIALSLSGDVHYEGDEVGIRRVITNLVTNAVGHTPSNSRIEVRVTGEHDSVTIEVCDEGPGMNSGEVARAFDRFWQADHSRSRQGTGLGLSIVQGVTHAHGGAVTLESSPTTGTTVRVWLPR